MCAKCHRMARPGLDHGLRQKEDKEDNKEDKEDKEERQEDKWTSAAISSDNSGHMTNNPFKPLTTKSKTAKHVVTPLSHLD
jgi:hypothetical protein